MAILLSNGNVGISTANGYRSAIAANLGCFGAGRLDLGTKRYIAFTPAQACNLESVVLAISFYYASVYTGYKAVVVDVEEYTGGSWVVRASHVKTAAEICDSAATTNNTTWLHTFTPLAAGVPYPVTADAGRWRIAVSLSGAQANNWYLRCSDSGSAYPFYALFGSLEASFGPGDVVVVRQGDTVTLDQATTFGGVLGTSDAANGVSVLVCKDGHLALQSPGAGTWTHTVSIVAFGAHSYIDWGSAASPISGVVIAWAALGGGTAMGIRQPLTGSAYTNSRGYVSICGAVPATQRTTLAADAAYGQPSVVVADDISPVVGDTVYIGWQNTNASGTRDRAARTIAGLTDASHWQLSSNLAGLSNVKRNATGCVVRSSGYGLKMTGAGALLDLIGASRLLVRGVESLQVRISQAGGACFDEPTNRAKAYIERCSYSALDNVNYADFITNLIYAREDGIALRHCDFVGGGQAYYAMAASGGYATVEVIENWFLAPYLAMYSHYVGAEGVAATPDIRDNVIENATSGCVVFMGVNPIWKNNICRSWHYQTPAVLFGATLCTGADMANNSYQGGGRVYAFRANAVLIRSAETGSHYGDALVNADQTLSVDAGVYADFRIVNPHGQGQMLPATPSNWSQGSRWSQINYAGTAGDYRSFTKFGSYRNDQAGGNPGRLIQQLTSATDAETNLLQIATQAVTGLKIRAVAGCRIAREVYYSGDHDLPRMDLYIDGQATPAGSATATASTEWQDLATAAVEFATNDNTIRLSLSTRSGAASVDTDVHWRDVLLYIRKFGHVFQTIRPTINQTTDEKLGIVVTPTANPFITLTESQTSALAGIAYDGRTITQSVSHTVAEIYQHFQAWATQSANMGKPVPFDTLDGINFTCSANYILDGCTLSGSGAQKIIQLGSHTYTRQNDGRTDGVVFIDATGTHVVIALSSIVPGSTVQVYDVTAGTELNNGILAGTSLNVYFVHAGSDHDIRIRVRKADYLPWETTGRLNVNGMTIPINQIPNPVYGQTGVDGSTVPEVSLEGDLIKILVDDPDGVTTVQRIIARYYYLIAAPEFIGRQPDYMDTPSAQWAQLLGGIQIRNVSSSPLTISGGNITDINNDPVPVFDRSTGGPIYLISPTPAANATDMAAATWAASTRTLTSPALSASEIADAVLGRDLAAVTAPASRSLLNAARSLRNKVSIDGGVLTVCREDDTTPAYTAAVTTSAAAQPITSVDPE